MLHTVDDPVDALKLDELPGAIVEEAGVICT
jgi:hypothetical protein